LSAADPAPAGRTAILGGTFDPVHEAHLAMARAAMGRAEFGLRRILFVPAANPPHKSGALMAPWEDRVRMVELACAGNPAFEVSRIEKDANPSYSVLTIERLLATGSGRLSFLIGADAFAEIRTWYRWRDVIRLTEFIVVTRPGFDYDAPAGAVVHELGGLDLPVSSSEIREGIARGEQNPAIPPAVLRYIRERGLYGAARRSG
jgi:nicotinate-nucleotide adenylyltransferase